MTETTIAAFWSAVAASFSAVAAITAILIQRRNLLESVKPELVLKGWARQARAEPRSSPEVISFSTIKNVGRGSALHVYLNCSRIVDEKPVAIMSTKRLPILAPSEELSIDMDITLWWENAEPANEDVRFIPIEVRILAWDSRGIRHETKYSLAAFELDRNIHVADNIAPGLALASRTTTSIPVWRLKARSKAASLPAIGKFFSENRN